MIFQEYSPLYEDLFDPEQVMTHMNPRFWRLKIVFFFNFILFAVLGKIAKFSIIFQEYSLYEDLFDPGQVMTDMNPHFWTKCCLSELSYSG